MRQSKLILSIAAVSALLGISAAVAADLPAATYSKAPAPVPVANWTGCYLGAGGGYGMSNQRREVVDGPGTIAFAHQPTADFDLVVDAAPGAVISSDTFGGKGWLGTAQVGCDYQFNGNWLVGAFADFDGTSIKDDHTLFDGFRGEQSMRWSWAAGARVGWLVTPTLLAYVSGGFTQAEFGGVNYTNDFATFDRASTSPTIDIASTGAPGIALGSQRYNGFFIGSGTEYAIGWLPGLFWKNEYRFADYRSATTSINCVPGCGPTGLYERIHPTVQTVRTELVWRFGGPVVAKY